MGWIVEFVGCDFLVQVELVPYRNGTNILVPKKSTNHQDYLDNVQNIWRQLKLFGTLRLRAEYHFAVPARQDGILVASVPDISSKKAISLQKYVCGS